jgi:hypothetical protein
MSHPIRPRAFLPVPGHGSADPILMKRLRRYATRAEKRGFKKTIGSMIYRPRSLVRALLPAPAEVRWVRGHSGKGGLQQRWERAALVIFLRMDPDAYYLLGLHDDERYSRAGEFVHARQFCNLHSHLARSIEPAVRAIVADKQRFFAFCSEHSVPTPPLLAAWNPDRVGFQCAEQPERLFRRYGELFFKPQEGLCGAGAGILAAEPNHRWTITSGPQRLDALAWPHVTAYFRRSGNPLIFQPRLRNHQMLARFGEHALHTVRVATMRLKGEILPWAAFLKIAGPEAIADNFAAGSIAVHVDVPSGRLGRGAKKAHSCLPASLVAVPETGEPFAGLTLPFWPETLALACRVHRLLDEFPSMAQDIAITETGPMVVEANEGWGCDGFQKASDIGLGKSTPPEYFAEHCRPA